MNGNGIWNRDQADEAARSVYRYMMHSKPAQWGGHEWTDWAMNADRWDWNAGVGVIAAAEFAGVTGGRGDSQRDRGVGSAQYRTVQGDSGY
ncbi:hypothetical protein [Cohnella rhizosphaerae]|uniref:Uncharacterized protein n=1 Tax=Cohnella rhizosphaerae TaxID=1457232 RepID=A0A9X4KSQ8_9BACL|nr:hypothetical protein [Cohnella rhizosphaerae]MDG0810003.1 hypothetical protein [Cohnella rhizosphaerae]